MSECPVGDINCIHHPLNDDEDYCFSPRMRFDIHAKCVQRMNEEKKFHEKNDDDKNNDDNVEQDYIEEIRQKYMPAFTTEQTILYMRLHPPSDYICCNGCKYDDCKYLSCEEKCDCCLGYCRCCADLCGHH